MIKRPDDEREQTDHALRIERNETDKKLLEARSKLEEEADATLEKARTRADAVLEQARALADTKVTESSVRRTMATERATEDATMETERAAADVHLNEERLERARVLADILRHERGETDRYLGTEREQMDAAIGARDDFLGMVAHDLRTLLSGMAMSAASLKTLAVDDDTRARVNREVARLERFTARMTRLVGDLIDVVSIEAGKLHVDAVADHHAARISDEVRRSRGSAAAPSGAAPIASTAEPTDEPISTVGGRRGRRNGQAGSRRRLRVAERSLWRSSASRRR